MILIHMPIRLLPSLTWLTHVVAIFCSVLRPRRLIVVIGIIAIRIWLWVIVMAHIRILIGSIKRIIHVRLLTIFLSIIAERNKSPKDLPPATKVGILNRSTNPIVLKPYTM